jgi:regulator of PEP synthase PpsR (kinase-PPPase family)
VRTPGQVDKALEGIKKNPGFVMYTLVGGNIRKLLKEGCEDLNVPCISVLTRVISDLSLYLGKKASDVFAGKQHELDERYFSRVEALNYSLAHDDGQSVWDLDEADIIIVGASRTSKSPTSMYLAHRGYRTANVPYVPGVELPETLFSAKQSLVVGLTISPESLIQIRKNRLLSLNENEETLYTDKETIRDELLQAKRLFAKNGWPMIDVTRRSIEETSANIIQYYERFREQRRAVL